MPTSRDTLYYDGACGLCRRSVRVLRALDWFGRLDFADSNATPDVDLPVDRATSLGGIPMRTRDGRALVGFPAARRALLNTPLGAAPALLLYLPGIAHAGRAVYDRIAMGRARDRNACTPRTQIDTLTAEDAR